MKSNIDFFFLSIAQLPYKLGAIDSHIDRMEKENTRNLKYSDWVQFKSPKMVVWYFFHPSTKRIRPS